MKNIFRRSAAIGLTVLGATLGVTSQASATPDDTVIVEIPGGFQTFKPLPKFIPHGGYTKDVGKQAQSKGYQVVTSTYNAVPFAINSYDRATNEGQQEAEKTIAQVAKKNPGKKIALVGYSEGADIASKITAKIGHGQGPISNDRLGNVALISNPHKSPDAGMKAGTDRDGQGVLGATPSYGEASSKVLDICNKGDIVCDSESHAGIRKHSPGFTSASPLTGLGTMNPSDGAYIATHIIPILTGFKTHTTSYGNNISQVVDHLTQ